MKFHELKDGDWFYTFEGALFIKIHGGRGRAFNAINLVSGLGWKINSIQDVSVQSDMKLSILFKK